jgi:hypothetical protein
MILAHRGYINQAQLELEVERAIQKFGPEVVRVRHNLGFDHDDDPSIFFRIVLRDSAVREETLGKTTSEIVKVIFDELRPGENWGINPHFSFRSESEVAVIKDRAWE